MQTDFSLRDSSSRDASPSKCFVVYPPRVDTIGVDLVLGARHDDTSVAAVTVVVQRIIKLVTPAGEMTEFMRDKKECVMRMHTCLTRSCNGLCSIVGTAATHVFVAAAVLQCMVVHGESSSSP